MGVYCKWQTRSRTLALERPQGSRGAPWLPVTLIHQLVAHQATPIRKLGITQVTGSALDKGRTIDGVVCEKARRLFVINLPTDFHCK